MTAKILNSETTHDSDSFSIRKSSFETCKKRKIKSGTQMNIPFPFRGAHESEQIKKSVFHFPNRN